MLLPVTYAASGGEYDPKGFKVVERGRHRAFLSEVSSGLASRPSLPRCLSSDERLHSPPLGDGEVVALGGSGVELARAADLLRRILDHLLPLRDPADRAGDREQHREHVGWEAHRLQGDA